MDTIDRNIMKIETEKNNEAILYIEGDYRCDICDEKGNFNDAILKKQYKFKPQREAWSAKMYVAYLKRKNKEL